MHLIFSKQESSFWQNYGILDLANFQVRLQYWVASLCNQLLTEILCNQFETLHRCFKHNEDVHVTFSRQENYFWQNYGILDLDKFQVMLQFWVASLCKQLLPGFGSNQFETLHRWYKHNEDLHMTFSRQENNFWQNYGILDLDNFQVMLQYWVATAILTLTFQTLLSSIDWMCWGSPVRMGQGVRTGLGHGGITCVLQTEFSGLFLI